MFNTKSGKRKLFITVFAAILAAGALIGGGLLSRQGNQFTQAIAAEGDTQTVVYGTIPNYQEFDLKTKPTDTESGRGIISVTDWDTLEDKRYAIEVPALNTYSVVYSTATCLAAGQNIYVFTPTVDLKGAALPEDAQVQIGFVTVAQARGHKYGETKESVAPTCTTAGVGVQTCENCGETKEVTLVATGHEFETEGTVTVAPTCTATGIRTFKCTHTNNGKPCTETRQEVIAATGHKFGDWETIAEATCTTTGTEARECSVCHAQETRTTNALGHDYADYAHDADGHWQVCSHDATHTTAKVAHTFVASGSEYKCSTCGYSIPVNATINEETFYGRGAEAVLVNNTAKVRFAFVFLKSEYEELQKLGNSVEYGTILKPVSVEGELKYGAANAVTANATRFVYETQIDGVAYVQWVVSLTVPNVSANSELEAVGYIKIGDNISYSDILNRKAVTLAEQKVENRDAEGKVTINQAVVDYLNAVATATENKGDKAYTPKYKQEDGVWMKNSGEVWLTLVDGTWKAPEAEAVVE